MVTINGSFFIESVEHLRVNEERLGDLPRWFSMVPATQGQINGYFSARRRGEFSTIISHSLSLFIGARVMLLKNIDTKEGLVNGRRGTVIEVIMSADVPDCVSAVKVALNRLNEQGDATVPITWIRVDSCQFPDRNTIHFYQIPLRLCYAFTAHKAQG
jgi:ATP-dependent exoDNAse (exonuclease V) alpha subunit